MVVVGDGQKATGGDTININPGSNRREKLFSPTSETGVSLIPASWVLYVPKQRVAGGEIHHLVSTRGPWSSHKHPLNLKIILSEEIDTLFTHCSSFRTTTGTCVKYQPL